MRRTIARGGRGRAHLGGSLATAADLAALVGPLVDIASQHDQQSLTDPESQLAILDAFAENAALRGEMAAAYAARAAAAAALAAFSADARARAEREDLLRFQLGELDAARPVPGEEQTLAAERERLRGAERFLAATAGGEETLYAADGAVSERIAAVLRELEPLAALDPALAPLVERLRERGGDRRGRRARSRSLRARRALGPGAPGGDRRAAVPAVAAAPQARRHGRRSRRPARGAGRRAGRGRLLRRGAGRAPGRGRRGGRARRRGGGRAVRVAQAARRRSLERKVDATLRELGFASARLPIALEARELGATGADRVRFLFAPNPGEEPRPLAKIASGGELSRVMLAVKQALARTDEVLTYVFDEVDAGIGGGAAEVIGRKLKRLAADRQVIVITHLAQVAAFADAHVRVTKSVSRGKTRVAIEPLADGERAGEIARMLAGAAPSPQAAAHADEMLRAARDA